MEGPWCLGASIFRTRSTKCPTHVNKTSSSEPQFDFFFSFLLQPTRKTESFKFTLAPITPWGYLEGKLEERWIRRWHLPSVLLVAFAALGERNFDAVHITSSTLFYFLRDDKYRSNYAGHMCLAMKKFVPRVGNTYAAAALENVASLACPCFICQPWLQQDYRKEWSSNIPSEFCRL